MAIQDRIRKLTYDDYARIPDDGKRHEIIDGELYVTPSPFRPHQGFSIELGSRLHLFVKSRRLGRVYAAAFDVILSEHDIVQPDLMFISNERAGIVTETNIQGAPDLVVEILSESTRRRDEGIKLHLYERSGVLEYWMFNTSRRTTRVYRQTPEGLRLVAELSAEAGDVLTTPLLPGLELPLSELFE
ncbi:MAG TPA: Uma2 family endonuclease [Thermoanaerobaculia bacterium]|nr:Uma2 family endonuclease [Thermoanaerobaculia bacterium]